VDESMMMMTH